jgi:hypothetical protein
VWRLAGGRPLRLFCKGGAGFRQPLRGFHAHQYSRKASPTPRAFRKTKCDDDVRLAIDQSDYLLALITVSTGPVIEKELNYALGKGKVIIPIAEKGIQDHSFLKKFLRIFWFSRLDGNPGMVETEVVQFLKQQEQDKQTRQALGL